MIKTLIPLALLNFTLAHAATTMEAIKAVAREGVGNEAASAAWKQIAQSKASELPLLLAAMDGANPLAENWLRAAIDVVQQHDSKALPIAELKAFLADTQHSPSARALAFDLIARHDPLDAETLTPSLLNDPSPELRRHPVGKLLTQGEAALAKKDNPAAITAFRQALSGARDEDQIKALAKHLRALGETVDLPHHFGFLMNWRLIAPFSNADRSGFDTVYPPEEKIDFAAKYPGKGKEATWIDFTSTDDYGKIDFNKVFGMEKSVVGYAATTFNSATERDAELRIGCKNGWKIWLNGQLLFARDEYHRGAKLDQYKLPCHLKAGANTLLVKCCQNEQTETWTVEWEFQLRVCDHTGTAIAAAP